MQNRGCESPLRLCPTGFEMAFNVPEQGNEGAEGPVWDWFTACDAAAAGASGKAETETETWFSKLLLSWFAR